MNKEAVTRHPRHADVASAIYGTILATTVVAGTSSSEEVSVTAGALIVLVTTMVFWLAHVYANLLAQRVVLKRRPSWAERAALAGQEWPLVQAGALPAFLLLLGTTGLYGRDTAFAIAMWSGVAALFVWGIVFARHEGRGIGFAILSGIFNAALGLIVIILKILVSH
jgi:hypothetical protein